MTGPRSLQYQGRAYTLRQLAEHTGVPRTTLHRRLESGMSVDEAVSASAPSLAQRGRTGARRSPWSRG